MDGLSTTPRHHSPPGDSPHAVCRLLASIAKAWRLLGRSRARRYRALRPPVPAGERAPRPTPGNALTDAERAHVLDDGTYLCPMSAVHRILRANHAARERRPPSRSRSWQHHEPPVRASQDDIVGRALLVVDHTYRRLAGIDQVDPSYNPSGAIRPLAS